MKGTKVLISENLVLELHRIGKQEGKPLTFLVEELIDAGLERREQREADKQACPF